MYACSTYVQLHTRASVASGSLDQPVMSSGHDLVRLGKGASGEGQARVSPRKGHGQATDEPRTANRQATDRLGKG